MSITTLNKSISGRFPSSTTQQLDDLLYRICEKLQLTESQHRVAEERYHAIGDWLAGKGSPLFKYNPRIYPQGSLKIGTTVKPKGQEEFDLDLVCELTIVDVKQSDPYVLIKAVYDRIASNDMYRQLLVPLKKRCVRLKYARDFHLDILPACPDTDAGGTCVWVPNKYDKVNNRWNWTPSNPLGYAEWFENRCKFRLVKAEAIEGVDPIPEPEDVDNKPTLKLAVQLMKRWRDIICESREDIPSIILTTLAAQLFKGESSVSDCLASIFDNIGLMTSQSPGPLKVLNPTNQKENLSEKWEKNPIIYYRFCQKVQEFCEYWHNLLQPRGIDKIGNILYLLFSEDVVKKVIAEYAQKLEGYRKDGNLYVSKDTGYLTNSESQSIPIRRNTFYGA